MRRWYVVLVLSAGLVSTTVVHAVEAELPKLKTFELAGRKICYVDEGEGKALMFLHNYASDHSDWRNQIASFSKEFRVIVPDLAFFGQSDPGPRAGWEL